MLSNKKIILVSTTDNMIWQFLLPHIEHLKSLGNTVECACAKTGFWFDELSQKYGLSMHQINFTRNPLSLSNLKAFKNLVKLQKENKYEVVYCQQPVGGVMGRKLGKKFHLPVIYTAHGFHFYNGCPLINKLIYKNVEKHYAKYTDALITINEEDYQSAKKFKAKKVYKINGIGFDINKYDKTEFDKSAFKKELGLTNEFVILTVAEFIKRKNYETMLKTIAGLRNENIKYLICGRGTEEENIKQQIKDLGIENKILLLGFRKDIDKIMQISDAFFLASHQEGLTLSVIEAMSFGLPCIVSDVRGNRDLIENEKGGFVSPENDEKLFANKIKTILADKKLCESMGNYNKAQSAQYSIEKVKNELEEIYKEI